MEILPNGVPSESAGFRQTGSTSCGANAVTTLTGLDIWSGAGSYAAVGGIVQTATLGRFSAAPGSLLAIHFFGSFDSNTWQLGDSCALIADTTTGTRINSANGMVNTPAGTFAPKFGGTFFFRVPTSGEFVLKMFNASAASRTISAAGLTVIMQRFA
jgi:hypothetical protein